MSADQDLSLFSYKPKDPAKLSGFCVKIEFSFKNVLSIKIKKRGFLNLYFLNKEKNKNLFHFKKTLKRMNPDQKGLEVDTKINKQGIVCHCFSPDLKSSQLFLFSSLTFSLFKKRNCCFQCREFHSRNL